MLAAAMRQGLFAGVWLPGGARQWVRTPLGLLGSVGICSLTVTGGLSMTVSLSRIVITGLESGAPDPPNCTPWEPWRSSAWARRTG